MADNPAQAKARAQLAARGNQLAPRVNTQTGATAAPRPATRRDVDDQADDDRPGPRRRGGQRRQGGPDDDIGQDGNGRPQRITLDVPKPFRATSRVLVVEFVLCLVLVALKPKEPATPGKVSEGVVPQLVAVMVVFLLLSALGAAGPRPQRVANLFGGLVTVVLAFKNHGNISAAVTSITSGTPAPPNIAPSLAPDTTAPGQSPAGGILPTPTGQPTQAQIITGWRGAFTVEPTPSGQASVAQQIIAGQ